MTDTGYAVQGRAGEYDDYCDWHVCVCATENMAQRVVENLVAATESLKRELGSAFDPLDPDHDYRAMRERELAVLARHPDPGAREGDQLFTITYWYDAVTLGPPAWFVERFVEAGAG